MNRMSEDEGKENQPVENEPVEEPEETEVEVPLPEETTEEVSTEPEAEAPAEEEAQAQAPEETLLLPRDTLLSAGIHIGTRMKTLDMEPFIYRVRPDGLFVLDVKKTDDRIRVTGKFLSRYEPARVAVAATRLYAHEPVKKFCQLTGATPLIGRFIPGQLSNPQYSSRIDPEIILVCDPRADAQAVKEAIQSRHTNCSIMQHRQRVRRRRPSNPNQQQRQTRTQQLYSGYLHDKCSANEANLARDRDPPASIEDFEAKVTREDEEEG